MAETAGAVEIFSAQRGLPYGGRAGERHRAPLPRNVVENQRKIAIGGLQQRPIFHERVRERYWNHVGIAREALAKMLRALG